MSLPEPEAHLCARCRAADNKSLDTMLSCPQCGAGGLGFIWWPKSCRWWFACGQCSMLLVSHESKGWYQDEGHYQTRRRWCRELTEAFVRGGLQGVQLSGTLYTRLLVK